MLQTKHLISIAACGILEDTAMESANLELAIKKLFQLIGRKLPYLNDVNIIDTIKEKELVVSTITNNVEKLHLSPTGEDYLFTFLNTPIPPYDHNSGNDEFWVELSLHHKFFHALNPTTKKLNGQHYKDVVYNRLIWLDNNKNYPHYKEEHQLLQSRIIWLEDIIREHTDIVD